MEILGHILQIGKTTLLKHMYAKKIHQFPPNLRVLLVEQEATGDDTPAVQVSKFY